MPAVPHASPTTRRNTSGPSTTNGTKTGSETQASASATVTTVDVVLRPSRTIAANLAKKTPATACPSNAAGAISRRWARPNCPATSLPYQAWIRGATAPTLSALSTAGSSTQTGNRRQRRTSHHRSRPATRSPARRAICRSLTARPRAYAAVSPPLPEPATPAAT